MKVFVYGTLRKGERNTHHLNEATCLHENAWVIGTLYDTLRGYPALFLNEQNNRSDHVYGEVYEIDDNILETIDVLEGYRPYREENLYERVTVKAFTDSAEPLDVITYVGGSTLQYCEKVIPLGEWKVHEYFKKSEILYFAYGSCMDDERFKQAGFNKYFTDVLGRGVLEDYNM